MTEVRIKPGEHGPAYRIEFWKDGVMFEMVETNSLKQVHNLVDKELKAS